MIRESLKFYIHEKTHWIEFFFFHLDFNDKKSLSSVCVVCSFAGSKEIKYSKYL